MSESHSKNSTRRPCAFRVDLLLHALDLMTIDQCRRRPGSLAKITISQRFDYLLRDRQMVDIYSSFHRSVLAYICHNSAKTSAKATVLPNECRILKIARASRLRRYPRIDQSASVIPVTSRATSAMLGSGRVSPPNCHRRTLLGKRTFPNTPVFVGTTRWSWDNILYLQGLVENKTIILRKCNRHHQANVVGN